MPDYEVVLKKVDAVRVAGVEDVIPTRNEIGPTFNRLFDEVSDFIERQGSQPAGPAIALWHDTEYREQDMHVAAAWPVANGLKGDDPRVRVHELPPATVASVVHTGSFDGFMAAYGALMAWVDANGFRISGPNREVYVQYERNGDPAKYVTEIQLPVEKK